MNDANSRDDAAVSDGLSEYSHRTSIDTKQPYPPDLVNGKVALSSEAAPVSGSNAKSSPLKATATPTATSAPASASNSTGSSSHLIRVEDYQYIDPNILKVLEKVDSQFSITNAITLSAVLKKWLHSCLCVVSSTHLPSVLKLCV